MIKLIKGNLVNIELANGSSKEYLIKEKHGITIGRIGIVEFSKINKYCCARIKFYKEDSEGIEYLSEALRMFVTSLFREMELYKINILADEEMFTGPFIDIGFMLEGIIINNVIIKGVKKSELLFGINYDIFSNGLRINVLRLHGKNIQLKILTVDDAKAMQEYYKRNKEHLYQYEPKRDDNFYSIEAQRQILIESYKQFLNGTCVTFGIFKDKRLVGKIQISGIIAGVFQNGIVGYSIDKDEQGKGYMKEALNLVIEYAFQEMCLHRLEASTLVDNKKSQAVLKSCGFQEVGLNKKYLFINGQWRDHITFYKTIEN